MTPGRWRGESRGSQYQLLPLRRPPAAILDPVRAAIDSLGQAQQIISVGLGVQLAVAPVDAADQQSD